jgi:nucleotide-binding universal stress UspA family protein
LYKRIMVTLDGSKVSEAILADAERLARATGAAVTLVMIAPSPKSTSEPLHAVVVAGVPAPGGVVEVPAPRIFQDKAQAMEHTQDELERYLEAKAKDLRAAGIDVETHVGFGKPAEEIGAHAKKCEADLIMMATHGSTGLAAAMFGNIALHVVASGVRPVYLVRPSNLA